MLIKMPGLLVCLVLQNASTMPVTCQVRRMLCQQMPGYKKSSKHLYVEIDNEKWNINILEDKIVVFLRFRVIKIVKNARCQSGDRHSHIPGPEMPVQPMLVDRKISKY